MTTTARQGLISRFFFRTGDTDREESAVEGSASLQHETWADNSTRLVHGLVKKVLEEPHCLIVTGYQDLLSSLTILLETLDDLDERPQGSIRIVFGSNTETR